MFDLYPRHSHRTPQQIAEDTGGAFEPARPRRFVDDPSEAVRRAGTNQPVTDDGHPKPDSAQPR